jgi:predicted DNA-binding protein with PD1-like motif
MQFKPTTAKDPYLIRLDRGELVVATLTKWCTERGITNAVFSGIGAVDTLTCGYYNLEEKKYYFTDYAEPLEVVSLTGNVMLKEHTPFIHAHGVFTTTENWALGGHIVDMRVSVVLEVVLTPLDSTIERHLDDCTGLALMKVSV